MIDEKTITILFENTAAALGAAEASKDDVRREIQRASAQARKAHDTDQHDALVALTALLEQGVGALDDLTPSVPAAYHDQWDALVRRLTRGLDPDRASQIVRNTAATFTMAAHRKDEWRGVVQGLADQAQQDGDEDTRGFLKAHIALMDGGKEAIPEITPTVPAAYHDLWDALTMQLDRLLSFDQLSEIIRKTAAVMSQPPVKKKRWKEGVQNLAQQANTYGDLDGRNFLYAIVALLERGTSAFNELTASVPEVVSGCVERAGHSAAPADQARCLLAGRETSYESTATDGADRRNRHSGGAARVAFAADAAQDARPDRSQPDRYIAGGWRTCRLAFALLTPPFYAPDEEAHFKYVQYLAENRSFPVQTSKTNDETNDWEYFQPPAYYVAMAPVYALTQPLLGEVGSLRVLRLGSVLLWLVTVYFSTRLLDRFGVQNAFTQIFVMSLICLLPTYTYVSSMVNSDNLLLALGSVILYVAAAPKQSIGQSLLLGVLMGVALLTKLPAILYPAVIAFSMVVSILRKKATFSSLFYSALAGLIGGGMMIPWLWRNLQVYGSLTAVDVANTLVIWRSVPDMVYALYEGMQDSFWAVSGIYNQVNVLYPNIGRGVSYVAVIGWVYTLITRREAIRAFAGKLTPLQIGLGLGILLNLGLVI